MKYVRVTVSVSELTAKKIGDVVNNFSTYRSKSALIEFLILNPRSIDEVIDNEHRKKNWN